MGQAALVLPVPTRADLCSRMARQEKTPAIAGAWTGMNRDSLADLRGIAEGDGEEESGQSQGKDEDVGEALHGGSSGEE